jgi:hypothetical protein
MPPPSKDDRRPNRIPFGDDGCRFRVSKRANHGLPNSASGTALLVVRSITNLAVPPGEGGAVLLFEDHRAAEIDGVGLASTFVIDDEKRAAVGEEFAAVTVRPQRDVATLAAAISFARLQADPLMLAASQNVASNGRSARAALSVGALSLACAKAGPPGGRPPSAGKIIAPIALKRISVAAALDRLLRLATMRRPRTRGTISSSPMLSPICC